MSVLIRGMEMPKDCVVCPLGWNGCNYQHDFEYTVERPFDCPLIPVPPHGRLIDADALPRFGGRKGLIHSADVDNAPTIVPADPAEEVE